MFEEVSFRQNLKETIFSITQEACMDQATTAIKEDFNILNEKIVTVENKSKVNENILKQKSAAVKQISHLKIVISNLTNQLHKGTPIQNKKNCVELSRMTRCQGCL